MNELALFAGVGGGLLGTRLLGWRPVCAVEKEPYRREVLLRRQRDGVFPLFPIWDDVRTFRLDNPECRPEIERLAAMSDLVVTAGFPCQPFSIAGKQLGEDDERNMWPDTIRIIREVGARWVMLENVTEILIHRYADTIFGDLAESGYCVPWDCLPASAFGADHKRDRLWIVADSMCQGLQRHISTRVAAKQSFTRYTPRRNSSDTWHPDGSIRCSRSDFHRKIDAPTNYVERLESLGLMQIPAVARAAWILLSGERELNELE